MHYYRFIFLLFFSFSFSYTQSFDSLAVDSADSLLPVFNSDPVIIEATRSGLPLLETPYAVENIEINDYQKAQRHISLEETLQSVAGLFVNNRNNFALGDRISIRGNGARSSFGVRGIKIMLDDIPLTMADGQSQLNNLDLGSVGKIEIIKGASSSLYGNAAAGVINISTEEAARQPLQFSPQFIIGSYDLVQLQGKLTGTYEKSAYLVNISHLKSNGFRENSAVQSWSVNAINHYQSSDKLKITTLLNYFDSPYALNPSSLSMEAIKKDRSAARYFVKQQGSAEKTRQGQAGVTFNYKTSQNDNLKLTIYGLKRSITNPIPSRIIELERSAAGLRFVYSGQSSFSGLNLRWTGGIDSEIQDDQRKEYSNQGIAVDLVDHIESSDIINKIIYGEKLQQQVEQVSGIGPFLNIQLPLYENWIFTFGARYDLYNFDVKDKFLADSSDDSGNIKMQQFSPMAGITYFIYPGHSLYLNYSSAYQTPTTAEFGNSPSGKGGLNSNLKPERIKNYEIGIKGVLPDYQLFYQSAFYFLHVSDMLVPFQNELSDEIFYRNAGRAQNTGIEFSLSGKIITALEFQLSYSYMDFKFLNYSITDPLSGAGKTINLKNKKVPGVAPQRFYTSAVYTSRSHFFSGLQLIWTDAYFVNDFNGDPSGNISKKAYINNSYTCINFRTGKTWSLKHFDIQFFAGIDNIFNTSYNGSVVPNAGNNNFYEPAPGRTWYSGIKLVL
jgi:iron complex outermembrane recepter protein